MVGWLGGRELVQRRDSELGKIQQRVHSEVARLAFAGRLVEEVDSLPRRLTDDAGLTNYRCCKYKERAVLAERIRLAMGFRPAGDTEAADQRLSALARRALEARASKLAAAHADAEDVTDPGYEAIPRDVVELIDIACDKCPIEKIVVTDTCRGCVGHFCRNSCNKDAIYIIHNRAFIDKDRCIECGRCVKACPFGAILHLERPCERSCGVGAISPGQSRNASIDRSKCVGCGACAAGCPFGAIAPVSDVLRVVQLLLDPTESVVAMLAPSFTGQFGHGVAADAIRQGLLDLGFRRVVEVAAGADSVARDEAQELVARATRGERAMATSCCPAFASLVRLHRPELAHLLSQTPSPMVRTAELLKASPHASDGERSPRVACVFVGPCHSKKLEAAGTGGLVDAALTFDELAALFTAKGIDLRAAPSKESPVAARTEEAGAALEAPTPAGRLFGGARGVAGAVGAAVERHVADGHGPGESASIELSVSSADGLTKCRECLAALAARLNAPGAKGAFDLMEGMACEAGCVGGPGTLVNALVADNAMRKLARLGETRE